jgi:hypothetical protein
VSSSLAAAPTVVVGVWMGWEPPHVHTLALICHVRGPSLPTIVGMIGVLWSLCGAWLLCRGLGLWTLGPVGGVDILAHIVS